MASGSIKYIFRGCIGSRREKLSDAVDAATDKLVTPTKDGWLWANFIPVSG